MVASARKFSPREVGRAGDIAVGSQRIIRAELQPGAVMELVGRREMDDVDRPARRAAAEERRARTFQHFDLLHPVERMRDAAELIAVRKPVAEDLGIEAADQEVIEIAERILAADVNAGRIVDAVAQHGAALLGQDFARDDMDAARQVGERRVRFAERRHLVGAVDTVALDRGAAGLRRAFDLHRRKVDRAVALIGRTLLRRGRDAAKSSFY